MIRCLPLLLPLALAACAPSPPPADPVAVDAVDAGRSVETAHGGRGLDAWHWHLGEAVDADGRRIDALFVPDRRPLQLNFVEGRLSAYGSCNRIGGAYRLEDGTLRVGAMEQTLMGCERPLMAQDEAIVALLSEAALELALGADDPPTLTLTAADGARLRFDGEPTADTRYGGPGERVFLEVAAQRAPCHHPLIADKQCLRVREVHYGEDGLRQGEPGEWTLLYEDIEGYAHEPGVRNVVRVSRYRRDPVPVPADASAIAYVHDMTVESAIE